MSGLEVIPIVTGIVCAAAAAKQIVSRARRKGENKTSYYSDDEYYDGRSRHPRRSRSRSRARNRSRSRLRNSSHSRSNSRSSRRSVSLSRDSPRGWTFMYKSRSKSRMLDRKASRSRSRPRRPQRRTHARQDSGRKRGRSPSPEHSTLSSSHRQPLRLNDQEVQLITSHWRHNPIIYLQLCKSEEIQVTRYHDRNGCAKVIYICQSCNQAIAESEIATWHFFLPKDQGEAWLHRDYILQNHAKNYRDFQCQICEAWVTGVEQLVLHFSSHRYAELRRFIPAAQWKGSLG